MLPAKITYARTIYGWLEESMKIKLGSKNIRQKGEDFVYRDRLDFVVEKSRQKPQVFVPRVSGSMYGYTAPYPKEIYLCTIVGSDNARNHVVALWDGWIFDANLSYALPYCKDSLDWCSGGGEYQCSFKQFGKSVVFYDKVFSI